MISNGKKTVEVRKRRPKIETPFKCYIYCTKSMTHLYKFPENIDCSDIGSYYTTEHNKYSLVPLGYMNGKVIGEFVCDRIEEIGFSPYNHGEYICKEQSFIEQSCVQFHEMFDYFGEEYGYGWHISDLKMYDKPKELSEFYQKCKSYYKDEWEYDDCLDCKNPCGNGGKLYLEKPPQSWCYVDENIRFDD